MDATAVCVVWGQKGGGQGERWGVWLVWFAGVGGKALLKFKRKFWRWMILLDILLNSWGTFLSSNSYLTTINLVSSTLASLKKAEYKYVFLFQSFENKNELQLNFDTLKYDL